MGQRTTENPVKPERDQKENGTRSKKENEIRK